MSRTSDTRDVEYMLERETIANKPKHWVRAVTACNSKCLFCLDSDTPRNVYLSEAEVKADIDCGIDELGAEKIIISGGEASLHPKFVEFVRYAKARGYDRVQTVTNGYRFAERDFYRASVDAGLGEITYSLHGHTAELHDYMTGMPDAFRRLMKSMIRAVRERRVIVNVDICINKQNVAHIDKIVELCIRAGVTEFDLLHVIPQAAAFDNRDLLFYDVRDHLPTLHKVFRLNRHPRFVVWTNRFPVSFLEGLEDLIQDPHKMLDEVNGRRWQVRRYLDTGEALDCRQPERCVHCFIEPFCTTMDRTIARQHAGAFDVWSVGAELEAAASATVPLPYGCTAIGVDVPDLDTLRALKLPPGVGVRVAIAPEATGPITVDDLPATPATLAVSSPAQLRAWLVDAAPPQCHPGVEFEIELNRDTAPWLLEHRAIVESRLDLVRLHQPTHEHMKTAAERDVRKPRDFFSALDLPIRISGLPACLAPGTVLIESPSTIGPALFDDDTGRLNIRELARTHVRGHYGAKSVRCADCRVSDRCEGAHINMVRDQGLGMYAPLIDGEWPDEAERQLVARWPKAPQRLATGRGSEPLAPSLPGFETPEAAPKDPLAVVAEAQMARHLAIAARRAKMARPGEAPLVMPDEPRRRPPGEA